jgi:hypothetical protein
MSKIVSFLLQLHGNNLFHPYHTLQISDELQYVYRCF